MAPAVRRRMRNQLRQGTAPEMALRRHLHAAGYRYRVGHPVPGMRRRTIDVAFTRQKLAVFVDGCFWHGCPAHFVQPKARRDFWQAKIAANRARDETTDAALLDAGWVVLRLWEHLPVDVAAATVRDSLVAAQVLNRGS